ncbi:MAG: sulfate permease [Actinobacteria bacterium]|nr:sulfate permease [Actinomycetota bacterium]
MLTTLWYLSTAIRGYLRFYMPTNRAVDWLRTPRRLKWAIPVALIATPVYLGLTALAIAFAARPDLGWLNVLAFLLFWNAMKFAWMAVLSVPLMLARVLGRVARPGLA